MPRPARLPDLTDVDLTELRLMILAVLDARNLGPEFRRAMRNPQIGAPLEAAGGARQVLAEAIEAIQRGNK